MNQKKLVENEHIINRHKKEIKSKEDSIQKQSEEINEARGKATHFEYYGFKIDGDVEDFVGKLVKNGWELVSKEFSCYNIYEKDRDVHSIVYFNKENGKVYAITDTYLSSIVGSLNDVAYTFADDYAVEPEEDMYGLCMEVDSVGIILFREDGDYITITFVDKINSHNYRAVYSY